MAEALPSEDISAQKGSPLDDIGDIGGATKPVVQANVPTGTPLDDLGDIGQEDFGTFGAGRRGAEKAALPAGGTLAGAGAGAELGGAIGAAGGPIGAAAGALVGGIGGGIAGGKAVETAQNWLLSKLPDGFKDRFGLDERTERMDQQQHPVASFVGGLVPYAVTMRPGPLMEKAALPENATALQRLMSNPVTARLFGGGVMGGMELTSELHDNEDLDWRKIGIATGFGMIWNKPTQLGESITEAGASPARRLLGRPSPTVAQAGDLKVMGPGITEQVFQGTHEQAPSAAQVAQETARAEHSEPVEPDVGAVARRMEPELFERYDELLKRREAFSAWKGEGPEQNAAGEHLVATNAEIQALSPEIAAAHRRAADTMGAETVPAEPFKSFADMLAAREGETGAQPAAGPVTSLVPRSTADQRSYIADDVAKRLVAAGRPEEEARAAGQVIAARYITRAGRFEGKLGQPEELYRRESAAIVGARGKPLAPQAAEQPKPEREAPSGRWRSQAPPESWSLFETLAHEGGLKPDPELEAIFGDKKGPSVAGFGKLVRPEGRTLDDALRVAKEHGYLADPSDVSGETPTLTPRDLLDRLAEENSGRKQYKINHVEDEKGPSKERSRLVTELQQEMSKHGESVDASLADRAAELVEQGKESDVMSAYERAVMEQRDLFEAAQNQPELTENVADFFQEARGKIRISPNARPVITLLKDANASTFIHESGHQFLEEMARDATHAEASDVVKQDIQTVRDWLGVKGKTFTTAKGSTYQLHTDSTTTRDKAARADVGHEGDSGLKPRSAKTIYLDKPELAASLSAAGMQNLGPKGARVAIKDGKAWLLTWNDAEGKWGVAPGSAAIPFSTEAKVGRAPLEVWKPSGDVPGYEAYSGMHAGNPITNIEDGGFETKHHEKFARGFEQYMREGVAPSQGLARVFGQFRNWLLSIYQSIKGLGSEISPEIRDVFDRMLELEPQRTVIAPERAQPDLLHDIHEAEAAHTEPHEAEPAMDRVIAEKERYIADQPPEVVRELETASAKVQAAAAAARGETAEPAGETGEGAGGPSALEPGGAGPEPEPGRGAGGAEHGAVQPSGGGSGPEGNAGSAGPDLRSKLGDHAGTALSPGPVDLFGPRESPVVDRAGNIRIDNLNTTDDVAQAIRVAAQENNEFIGDRRGVITDGQVLELADALGMDVEALNRRQLGQAFNAEQIVAARRLLIQSATTVSEAMKKAATGSDADVMAYAQAKDRHQMIQAHVAGITAEAGRALRAFRSLAGMEQAKEIGQFVQEATGKTLFQLRAEAKLGAELQTPQQVSKMMVDAQKHSFGRMVLEYWINGLISGPATHMTYAVGNTISSILRVPETGAAAVVSRAAAALGREGTGVRSGEALAMARGAVEGIPAAIKAGIGGLQTGLTTTLPGETAAQGNLFQPGMGAAKEFQEGATYHDAMAAAFGMVRGMRDGIVATGKLLSAGGVHGEPLVSAQYSPLGAIPDIAVRGVNVLPVGSVVRAPGRFIAAIHSFYRSINFSMEKNALAYRKAVDEGHEGEALASRVAQIRADPTETQMNDIAVHSATQTVLMGRGSELTQALSRVTNARIFGFPLLKFIDPFVHISGNIIEQAVIQRTPVGLLTMLGPETELARDLTGKNGNAAQDKAVGRMLVGSVLSMTFGGLAAQGLMSGSGPKDPKEAAMWRLAGNQAHSVRVGDIWYDVHKLGPLGMLGGISADLYEVAHEAEHGEFLAAAAHLQHAFAQNILDESFMRGPAELIQAIEDPGRFGESYIRNFLASFVPFSVGMAQVARASDPYTRQARTVTDAIKAKIPGLSESLMPRRDIWGEIMPSREVLGMPGVSAIYMTRMSNDPVNKAMLDLNLHPGSVEKKIRGVELTPQEYDDFARIAGKMTKPTLDKIVTSPAWSEWPVESKRYAIQHSIEAARETARNMVIAKYTHIARDAAVVKQKRARGEKP